MLSDEAITSLLSCRSVGGILSLLLRNLSDTPFRSIRYYHYDPSRERLVSIDSAGMPRPVAEALRDGAIIKFRRSSPLWSHDSFWCFHLRRPVVFAVDHRRPRGRLRARSMLPQTKGMFLVSDQCRKELRGVKTSRWVDCPLIVGDKRIGKLSCDLAPRTQLRPALQSSVDRLWLLARLVAPLLEHLHKEPLSPLADIREEIAQCRSMAALLTYCTTKLARKYFRCKYASFFSRSEDVFGSRKLILRKTSFPKLKPQEDKAFYYLSEPGLTPWVARHHQSVRLHLLDDSRALAEQLKAYGRDIRWVNKYADSDAHNTFLAVPIGDRRTPLGVLRYAEKHDGRFTESDQILLERVAGDCIGPRLLSLSRSAFIPELIDNIQEMHAVSLSFSSGLPLPQELCRAMERCFRGKRGSKKLYLINLLEDDPDNFRHYAIGGGLRRVSSLSDRYRLEGSFTGKVLKAGAGRAVSVNDCTRAHDVGGFHLICPSAVCALGSPLVLRGYHFGALAVLSDMYDILEPQHAHSLAILAGEVGQLFGLRRLLDASSGLVGIRHDCATILNEIERLTAESKGEWRAEVGDLVRFMLETVDTYCRPTPRDPKDFVRFDCGPANVAEEVQLAATVAQREVGEVSGLDCRIDPGLTVRIQPSFLMNIIYNLLKNAWGATPKDGPLVVVSGRVIGGYLEVSIIDHGKGLSEIEAEQYSHERPVHWLTAGILQRGVKGRGLLVAQRIAAWHTCPDGRRGEVKVHTLEGQPGVCAVVRLPIHRLRN